MIDASSTSSALILLINSRTIIIYPYFVSLFSVILFVQLSNGVYLRAPSAMKTGKDATKVPPVNILAPLQPYHAPTSNQEYKDKNEEKARSKEKERQKDKDKGKEATASHTGASAKDTAVKSSALTPPLPTPTPLPLPPAPALKTHWDTRGNAELVQPTPPKLDFVFAQPTTFPSRDAPKK